jgi:hypothetical protein
LTFGVCVHHAVLKGREFLWTCYHFSHFWECAVFVQLVAKLLGVEAGQDAVIRTEMYRQKDKVVWPYNYTVADFSNAISSLRNNASHAFVDEGLVVPKYLGAEGMITGNILSADADSLSYARTAAQVLATVYGTGSPSKPGGFYPKGGRGPIAESYLNTTS